MVSVGLGPRFGLSVVPRSLPRSTLPLSLVRGLAVGLEGDFRLAFVVLIEGVWGDNRAFSGEGSSSREPSRL